MAVTAEELRAQQAAAYAAQEGPAEPGTVERVLRSAQRLVHGYALLAVLDLRRATVQFVWLVACGLFVAVLAVTAWLGALTALITWLLGHELSWPAVLLIGAGVNVAGAVLFGLRIKHLLSEMPFAATLRQLKGDPPEIDA
jgi:uncharacterized membrane protein YqjE